MEFDADMSQWPQTFEQQCSYYNWPLCEVNNAPAVYPNELAENGFSVCSLENKDCTQASRLDKG